MLIKKILEYSTEISFILISLGLLGFLKLADVVVEGETYSFDKQVLLWFRNPDNITDPAGPKWLEVIMRDITALGGMLFLGLLTFAICGYLWLQRQRVLALFLAVSIPTGSLVNSLLKEIFARARPDIFPHGTAAALSSFPSGHAMMSALVFLTIGALLSWINDELKIKIYILSWSVFLTIMVGVSRLYLGVHWPTDILAGWIIGSIWALISLLVFQRLLPKTTRDLAS